MSEDNIVISGVAKLAIPVVAIFFIQACKDIICKWLDRAAPSQNGPNTQNTPPCASAPMPASIVGSNSSIAAPVPAASPKLTIVENYKNTK